MEIWNEADGAYRNVVKHIITHENNISIEPIVLSYNLFEIRVDKQVYIYFLIIFYGKRRVG